MDKIKCYALLINDKGDIAVDDSILVKDAEACQGSRILEGFKPLFSAEAVERLEKAGYVISGKTHVGEFGLDLAGEFSYYAPAEDQIRGAAAELVKSGEVKAALGVDMNGSTRRAAALSDICFLRPTYGTVSRYGVMSCAASGEQIGVYGADTAEIAKVMSVIAGHDPKDGTSLPAESYLYKDDADISDRTFAVVSDLTDMADEDAKARIASFVKKLEAKGAAVESVSLRNLFDMANTAWQMLMCAETCNNISKYDGVKYGYRSPEYRNIDELYVNSRTDGFNFLTKAVILYGSDVLSKSRYKDGYEKSLKVRRLVTEELKSLFEKYDALITPVCSSSSFEAYDIKDAFRKSFEEGLFTSVPAMAGAPAIASGPVQIIGRHFDESLLLSLAAAERKEA